MEEARSRWTEENDLSLWLDRLQWLVAMLVLALCFRGQGGHLELVVLLLLVPAGRFTASSGFRHRIVSRLHTLWRDFQAYPSRDSDVPWRATLVWVILPAAGFYLVSTCHLATGDSWPVIPTSCSLVTAGHWNVDAFEQLCPATYRTAPEGLPYWGMRIGGQLYSRYPAGMVLFGLPVAAMGEFLGADFHRAGVLRRLEKWTSAWIAAGSLGLFFLIALHLVSPSQAWLVTFLLATASVMFSTVSQGLWQHGGLIFWSLLLLFAEFQGGKRPVPAGNMLQGIACAMMLACRLTAAPLIVAFGIWVFIRSPKRALIIGGAAMLGFAPWAWLYGSIYGNVFGPSIQQTAGNNWTLDLAPGLAGVLFSPSRGLLVYQSWLLLATAAIFPAVRRPMATRGQEALPAGWWIFCLVVISLHLVMIAGWRCWCGGDCWGSRLASEIIPLAALVCARPIAALWNLSMGRPAVILAAILAFLVHAPATYWHAANWNTRVDIGHHPEKLWSWSQAPFLYPLQRDNPWTTADMPDCGFGGGEGPVRSRGGGGRVKSCLKSALFWLSANSGHKTYT